MKTILLTNIYKGRPLEIVASETPAGFRMIMPERSTQEALEHVAGEADYILAGGRLLLNRAVLDKAARLQMVQRSGVGLDTIDLAELARRGIPLYVNRGVNAQSTAEHTLLLMLACLRHLPVLHRNTSHGIWNKQEQGTHTRELCGRTVGLIGMGNIGRRVAELLAAFGAESLYYAPHRLQNEEETMLGLKYAAIEELFSRSDIISLHCALTGQTARLIDRRAISKMKDGAILINTARGGLTDMDAVAEALRSGKLSFAGLDVYDEEPLPSGHMLCMLDNVILTPHIGGITYDSFRQMMHAAMKNIAAFDAGRFNEIQQHLVHE